MKIWFYKLHEPSLHWNYCKFSKKTLEIGLYYFNLIIVWGKDEI